MPRTHSRASLPNCQFNGIRYTRFAVSSHLGHNLGNHLVNEIAITDVQVTYTPNTDLIAECVLIELLSSVYTIENLGERASERAANFYCL